MRAENSAAHRQKMCKEQLVNCIKDKQTLNDLPNTFLN